MHQSEVLHANKLVPEVSNVHELSSTILHKMKSPASIVTCQNFSKTGIVLLWVKKGDLTCKHVSTMKVSMWKDILPVVVLRSWHLEKMANRNSLCKWTEKNIQLHLKLIWGEASSTNANTKLMLSRFELKYNIAYTHFEIHPLLYTRCLHDLYKINTDNTTYFLFTTIQCSTLKTDLL